MAVSCFIGGSMLVATILAVLFTLGAVVLSIISHPHDKKGKYVGYGMVILTVVTYALFPCWAYLVGLIELVIAFIVNRNNLRILRLD